MSLDLTPVHRNLHTKVTFLGLEFEDLILVLALAALMNLLAHFVSGNAHVFGIHTRLGAESEPVILDVEDGVPLDTEDIVIHFSIPPRNAWNNVHQHCSLVLAFQSEADIVAWCEKHGQSYGEAVPLATTAKLARRWYGPYAKPSWRKWTVEQAQEIFQESGLTSPFWELSGKGTY